jgi:hypothetical protein
MKWIKSGQGTKFFQAHMPPSDIRKIGSPIQLKNDNGQVHPVIKIQHFLLEDLLQVATNLSCLEELLQRRD